tara:strand:+ start:929 stop:1213 length:285 start_codon:yes stop_codon:yes gene_type:complete
MAKKKLTMKEAEEILHVMNRRLQNAEQAIQSLDSAISSYIDFGGKADEWKLWVMKEIEKQKKESENEPKSKKSGNSSGKNRDTKTRKKTSKKTS